MRLLLVEDDPLLGEGVAAALTLEGYTVDWLQDGQQALNGLQTDKFSLVILDLGLPGMDGIEVLTNARKMGVTTPILILTARDAVPDRIAGLDHGADDYLTKPFHLQELLARIKGMLRRKEWYREITEDQPVYRFGDNVINFDNLTARVRSREIKLTQREALVFKFLIERKGKIVSRKELLEKVWDTSGVL